MQLGSNELIGEGFKFVIDGEPIFKLESDKNGRLLISLDLYSPDDELLISVARNEWITGDPLPWDFEFGFNTLTLRRKTRDVSLHIDARKMPTKMTAKLWRRSQSFTVTPRALLFNGKSRELRVNHMAIVNMQLSVDSDSGTFSFLTDPGRPGCMITSGDQTKRIDLGIAKSEEFKRVQKTDSPATGLILHPGSTFTMMAEEPKKE